MGDLPMRPKLTPSSSGLEMLMSAAAARHAARDGWPTTKDEAWRFTNLNALRARDFTPAQNVVFDGDAAPEKNIIQFMSGICQDIEKLTLSDGISASRPSDNAALVEGINEVTEHPVIDLSLTSVDAPLAITVDSKTTAPLTLRFQHQGGDISSHAVVVIEVKKGARLTLIEDHSGLDGLSAPLIRIHLADGAKMEHYRRLATNPEHYHLGVTIVRLEADSAYQNYSVISGGVLSRTETHITLGGARADARMNSVCLGRGERQTDITSTVKHDAPDCHSMQIVHSVLDDAAKSVFQGKISVARAAQKTDGNQMSRAILLSRKCEANTKPELEIYADDVACSHGATMGELGDEQVFYLKSRGLTDHEARRMLIEAFLLEVIETIEDSEHHAWMLEPIKTWLAMDDSRPLKG